MKYVKHDAFTIIIRNALVRLLEHLQYRKSKASRPGAPEYWQEQIDICANCLASLDTMRFETKD